ncbi:breast cancer anti-estrogen resistance protein 3-like [Arapaima gigas]
MHCVFWGSEFVGKMSERCKPLQGITSALCCFFQKHSIIKEQQFSKENIMVENNTIALCKELEEELKWSSEEPCSHTWYYGVLPQEVAEHLVTREADVLVRDSASIPGSYLPTAQEKGTSQHCQITKGVVMASAAYQWAQYLLDGEAFKKTPALVHHCVGDCEPVLEQVGAVISQPFTHGLPLQCLEEIHRSEGVLFLRRVQPSGCQSINIKNGHCQEYTSCDGDLQRIEERCLNQPVCVNREQTLARHQSESIFPLGITDTKYMETLVGSMALVFQMGRELPLSYAMPTLAYKELTELSFSNPPIKPSMTSSVKLAHVLHTQPCDSSSDSLQHLQKLQRDLSFSELKTFNWALKDRLFIPLSCARISEELRTGEGESSCQQKPSVGLAQRNKNLHCPCLDVQKVPDKKKGHILLEMLEERKETVTELHQTQQREKGFQPPVFQTTSVFCPREFRSRLLPTANKPLDMSILKKIKELLDCQNNRTIAKHILQADCKVARILHISEKVKEEMGVNSGLELVTLPHGRQLRQDLMERHSTMAFWVAVSILACTGHPEERAEALNRFLLIAQELKDTVGDLFAFSAILKGVEMLQIRRLEHSWTSLRRRHPHTAIMYDKHLKPFFKGLYKGSITVTPGSTTVPFLMPLLTLMEIPSVVTDSGDIWDIDDLGCDSTLRHLESARIMARNTEACVTNAEWILQEFQPNEDLLEIFTTDFQLRLLWGSRGALMDQKERVDKFNLILTALSRKLEPSVK